MFSYTSEVKELKDQILTVSQKFQDICIDYANDESYVHLDLPKSWKLQDAEI